MRLLRLDALGELILTGDVTPPPAPYAILSHTWGAQDDEVTFNDMEKNTGKNKAGYAKLWFCANQAQKDGLEYCWVDTCCINRENHVELSEAITSMFRWYQEAAICYVYLSDVLVGGKTPQLTGRMWENALRASRWFTRGWTLQELLAPASVEFFSVEGQVLGNKQTLEGLIHSITNLPIAALQGAPLSTFTVDERLRWTTGRVTTKLEDQAYCLLGIFGIFMPLIYGEGRNAETRLLEEIKKVAVSTPAFVHTHWTVTRSPNPLFTGREDTLQALCSTISNTLTYPPYQEQCRIVVSGMGGQGKSEICLQLAHRFRQKFWGVFWIDVSSTSLAERSLVNLAQTLSLPAQTWEEACLGIANLKYPWLLVLDNADDPALDYQPYIPNSPLGVVMVTSRNEECQQYASAAGTMLEGLSPNAARDLLLKAACMPITPDTIENSHAIRVAMLLHSHPLALIQAGTYISRGHCRLDQYPALYKQQRQRLLQFRPNQARSRYRDVYATFEASANALQQLQTVAAGDALVLFPLLAVCGTSPLPLALFQAGWEGARKVSPTMADDAKDNEVELLTPWHASRLPAFLDSGDTVWDSFRLVEAVQLLKAFALVSTDNAGESMTVSMHPLVHAWARDRQNADEQQHMHWLSMGCVVAFAQVAGMSRALDQQLQAHIESVVEWDMSTMFANSSRILVARVLVRCGWLLIQLRSDNTLGSLVRRLLSHLRLDLTTVVEPWLGLFDLAARNLDYCGKPQQAIGVLEQVVGLRKQSVAAGHPSLLSSQYGLAVAYEANEQVTEAVALLEEVMQFHAQSLAADHPSRLASQYTLAEAYKANGQVTEAVALLKEVVQIWSQSTATDHPDRLASQHALAGAYLANGQVTEAVTLLEEVVQIESQSMAANHPARLASQHDLARAYRANGQVMEAMVLLEDVVHISSQSLAADHPSQLVSQRELARVYIANGQVLEAVALLEEVVQIESQSLVADHPSRLASQQNLAIYLWSLGQHSRARAMMKNVVTIGKTSLDERHPGLQSSEKWLEYFGQEEDAVE